MALVLEVQYVWLGPIHQAAAPSHNPGIHRVRPASRCDRELYTRHREIPMIKIMPFRVPAKTKITEMKTVLNHYNNLRILQHEQLKNKHNIFDIISTQKYNQVSRHTYDTKHSIMHA